jgi:CubicO group peptidase (beta-lactamase class C family)
MMSRFFALALLSLFAAPMPVRAEGTVPVPVTPAVAARLDAALAAVTGGAKGQTPALSVAIVENGTVAYARAFGTADIAGKTPATPQTRFRIASVTKMFTAVAVLQQVEAGRVGLDRPLSTYVDVPHASEVTIRQLLTHTSGIWNYGDAVFASPRVTETVTPRDIMAFVGPRALERAPGSGFSYSNTGYVLLAMVVENVTHQAYATYLREHVFAPAAMRDTTVGDPPAGTPAAVGYNDATGTPAMAFSLSWLFADGDIVSTAADVARFDIALMNGRLIKPATFALMQSSSVAADEMAPGARYGLGVSIVTSGGATFVGHHGGVPGFEAENEIIPDQRYAIVVLSDAFDFRTPAANRAIITETLPGVASAARAAAASASPVPSAEDPAITERVRKLVVSLQNGTLDRTALTDAMSAAFTPAVVDAVRAQLAPLGALKTLAFRDRTSTQGVVAYRYTATFATGPAVPLTISFDKDGKIAGFFGG